MNRDWINLVNRTKLSYLELEKKKGKEHIRHLVRCIVKNIEPYHSGTNILHQIIHEDWISYAFVLLSAPSEIQRPSIEGRLELLKNISLFARSKLSLFLLREILHNLFSAFDLVLKMEDEIWNSSYEENENDPDILTKIYFHFEVMSQNDFRLTYLYLRILKNFLYLFHSTNKGNKGVNCETLSIDIEKTDWERIIFTSDPAILSLLPKEKKPGKHVLLSNVNSAPVEEKKVLIDLYSSLWNVEILLPENREEDARKLQMSSLNYPMLYIPPNVSPSWLSSNILSSGVEKTLELVKEKNKEYILSLLPEGKELINMTLPTTMEGFENYSPLSLHLVPSLNGHFYILSDFDLRDGVNVYTKEETSIAPRYVDPSLISLESLWENVIGHPI